MQFAQSIKEYDLVDIVTVDETHYALTLSNQLVPGCTTLPLAQLHTRLREFLNNGYSQRYRQPYKMIVGLASWTLFAYSLERLPPTRKQVFSHALMGTTSREGMLSRWNGQKLGRSAFFVPTEREADALTFLTRWGVDYTREVLLRGN